LVRHDVTMGYYTEEEAGRLFGSQPVDTVLPSISHKPG
jgi:hypothetical protein